MEKSSSCGELIVRKQFDRLCKLALKRELIDVGRHEDYMRKHEKLFSELSEKDLNQIAVWDEYDTENSWFQVLGYDIEVKDRLLADALQKLSEKKRNIILLSYYVGMSDVEIGDRMNLDDSTICRHRKKLLELLKVTMEEMANEENQKEKKR